MDLGSRQSRKREGGWGREGPWGPGKMQSLASQDGTSAQLLHVTRVPVTVANSAWPTEGPALVLCIRSCHHSHSTEEGLREVQTPAQSHTAGERQSQDLSLRLWDSRAPALHQDITQPLPDGQLAGPERPVLPQHADPAQRGGWCSSVFLKPNSTPASLGLCNNIEAPFQADGVRIPGNRAHV